MGLGWKTLLQVNLWSVKIKTKMDELTFPSGFPGCEFQIREALAEVLGETKASYFFDKVR